jgi:TPR repeat protein
MACTLVGQFQEAESDGEADPTTWFEKGCEAGDPLGCDRLAYRRESDGAETPEFLPLYRKACQQGVGVACRRQVILRAANNLLDEGGPGEVWKLHRRVCRRDVYPPICRDHEPVDWLALGHHPEHVVDAGSTLRGTAMVFYERACRADDKYGCWLWGKGILGSAEPTHRAGSWERATDRWQRACDMNHRAACTRLADHYMQVAQGDRARLEKAEELLAKACRRRYFDACMTLGRALSEGGELPANPERAASVFEGACKAGHQPACDPEAATDGLDIPSD